MAGKEFLKNYLHATGFFSICVYRRERLKFLFDTEEISRAYQRTNWPGLFIGALAIRPDSKVHVISEALVFKNDNNVNNGPDEHINLYIYDISQLMNFFRRMKLTSVRYSASYPQMIDLKLIRYLIVLYMFDERGVSYAGRIFNLSKKVDINITGNIKNDLDKIAYECMTKWKEYFKNCYSKIIELFYGQMASFIDING